MIEIKIRVFNTREEKKKYVYILDISGILDAGSFPEFETHLENLLAKQGYNMAMNCKKLEFISSTCLGLLLKVIHAARKNGGDLCLLNPSAPIQRVVKILGFSKFFRTFQEEAQVLTYFDQKHQG